MKTEITLIIRSSRIKATQFCTNQWSTDAQLVEHEIQDRRVASARLVGGIVLRP